MDATLTEFVGRQADLDALHSGGRLVTILGPAGMGKTRLAAEYARTVDSVFCELAHVTDAEGMRGAVAEAVGASLEDPLGSALASRTLVVLDNLEQVVGPAAALISTWMREAPQTRFIVTSRERLHIGGEQVLELDPLADADAVALFAQRARSLARHFDLSDADEAVVTEITQRLDGLPLAIELAASRMNVMTAQMLRDRLSVSILRDGRRDRTARQRTMEGAIAWSWDLLDPAERHALGQCAVFRGGFSLEAAEAVLEVDDVLEALQMLRDKSLLRATVTPSSAMRFGMFEAIREFVQARTDLDAVRTRHTAYYLDLGESLAARIMGPDGAAALAELGRERQNLLAIHSGDDPHSAVRAALALEPLLARRGPAELRFKVMDQALARQDDPALRLARGNALRQSGDMEAARADLEAAAASPDLEPLARAYLAIIDRSVGHKSAAKTGYQRAIELARGRDVPLAEAICLLELGFLALEEGHRAEAESFCAQALAVARPIGAAQVVGLALVQMANLQLSRGQHSAAERWYREALDHAVATRNVRNEGIVRCNLGMVYMELGKPEGEPLIREALTLCEQVGNRRFTAICHGYLGVAARERGDLEAAEASTRRSLAIHEAMGTLRWQIVETGNLGIIRMMRGDVEGARTQIEQAVTLSEGNAGLYVAVLATLRFDQGEPHDALLEAARQLLADPDDPTPTRLWRLAAAYVGAEDAAAVLADTRDVAVPDVQFLRRRLLSRHDRPVATLTLGPDAAWFRVGDTPVDISRRRVLRRVLAALHAHAQRHPDEPLTTEALLAAGWPGERILPKAGQNRVYVAINTLRKLGLDDHLETTAEGYLLRV